MIKPTELRLGNYVNLNDGSDIDDFRKVSGIGSKILYLRIKQCRVSEVHVNFNRVYPIPLTEELLEKCGFQELYRTDHSIRLELMDYPEIEYKWNATFNWMLTYKTTVIGNVKYLHELQNAVYFLTGKELDVQIRNN